MSAYELLMDLMISLKQMDEMLSRSDINATLRKVHECMEMIKTYCKVEELCKSCEGKGGADVNVETNIGTKIDVKIRCPLCEGRGAVEK